MFKLDDTKVPDGTVLAMGIRYEGQTSDKVWTYGLLKAGGLWYMTGSSTPTAAGWGAINRWLGKDGRVVLWVRMVNSWNHLYDHEIPSGPVDTSQAPE